MWADSKYTTDRLLLNQMHAGEKQLGSGIYGNFSEAILAESLQEISS